MLKCCCVLKRLLLILAAYLYCAVLDPFFFDYPALVLPLRQLYGVMLAAGILYLFVRLQWLGVILYVFSGLIFGLLHYAYVFFGYTAGFELISAIFETNVHEVGGFVTLSSILALVGGVILLAVVFALAVCGLGWRKFRIREICRVGGIAVLWGVVYSIPEVTIGKRHGMYQKLSDNTLRNTHELFVNGHYGIAVQRWQSPYSNLTAIYHGLGAYFRDIVMDDATRYHSVDCRNGEDLVFIMVFGESIRADHVPAGGYARNTMPEIGAEPGAVFYTRMYSYAASTYDSIAAMLSGMVRPGDIPGLTSFAGILKKHGFEGRLYSENTENITDSKLFHVLLGQYMSSCNKCRAPIMSVCKTIVDDIQNCGAERQLIVVENGTGHFPYVNEDEYDTFKPCNLNWMASLPDNKKEILINDYDNCIVSVDKFLAGIIDGVRNRNAVMLYVSDHGQLLFEGGKLMHGDPHNVLLRQPAAFVWFSDEYRRRHPELVAEMEAVRDKPLVHGQVYATVLKLCGVESSVPLRIGDFVTDDVRKHPNNVPVELLRE